MLNSIPKSEDSWRSWGETAKKRLLEELKIQQARLNPAISTIRPPSLSRFVERTTTLTLDRWQQHFCARLQRLGHEKGQRILVHAAPQHGKSIICSQRFPAWYLGVRPKARVKLACYNVTHACGFSKIVREVMQSEEYREMFPNESLRLPKMSSS